MSVDQLRKLETDVEILDKRVQRLEAGLETIRELATRCARSGDAATHSFGLGRALQIAEFALDPTIFDQASEVLRGK